MTGGLLFSTLCGGLSGAAVPPVETGQEREEGPRRITPGQRLSTNAEGQWAEVEGEITFASEQRSGLVLEVRSSTGRLQVTVPDRSRMSPLLLLHSRVRVRGQIQVTTTFDGDEVAGSVLTPGMEHVQVLEWPTALWNSYATVPIGSLGQTNALSSAEGVVRVHGRVSAILPDRKLVVADGTGEVLVETLQRPPRAVGTQIEVLGRRERQGTDAVLVCGGYREDRDGEAELLDLPQLTRVEQIKSLSPAEAQRGYPVKIRGVVTSVLRNGFFIQDATWAVYVICPATTGRERPGPSEYWQVEGVTCEGFAPSITPERLTWLAVGAMPEPLRPSWDQLINGSLDAQYVEMQGIVTWVQGSEMSLLTRSGKINIRLVETPPRPLKDYEGAMVRLRGCVIPGRETSTMRVQLGRIELSNYLINIDEPAPTDPFATPLRRVPELLLFNWRASAIERIRTSGQVVHGRNGEYYLMDGTNGLRFFPKPAVTLAAGEQVEVVGFPGLGGPSPVLREALVQRKGITPMPSARTIGPEMLMSRHNDATLVRVQGRLVNISRHRAEEVLELRTETHGFLARLEASPHVRRDLLRGSLLELIGVYSGQGINQASGREVDAFELLLNTPADIRVLETPSWWTLQRVLWGLGATSLVAMISLGWVFTLRGEVRRKTRILQQKVEREAVLEERTRIAREFHDTIEQEVAAVTLQLQAARARIDKSPEFVRHALQLAESMLRHAQSEARHSVWNLRAQALENGSLREALGAVANYARNGAEVQTEVRVEGAERVLPGRFENHLLRICQEATSNAIKHGQARHVTITLSYGQDRVRLSIKDDGKGFAVASAPSGAAGHFGLLGMQERAEKTGGALTITSAPGQGTEIILDAPLPGTGGTSPQHATTS